MNRAIKLLLCSIFFIHTSLSFGSDLEFKLPNKKSKEVDAGVNMNVLIMFKNNEDTDKTLEIKLNQKGFDWRFISDYSSILVEKKSSTNKICGIYIPRSLGAGDYSVELEAFDKSNGSSLGIVNIPITVKPRYELAIEKTNSPRFLFAGDTLSIGFSIQNKSNLDASVSIKSVNGSNSKVNYVTIKKDSSLIWKIPVSIAKNITTYLHQTTAVIATISDKPETEKSMFQSYDVFPKDNVKFDAFNRFPIKISGLFVTSNRRGKQEFGTMYDIHGVGSINEAKNQKLEIHLRGPDRSGNPLFGLNDEYSLTYTSPKIEMAVGDNNFGLSDLTESSRNGRGVKLQYNHKKLSFGSYYNAPRYFPSIKRIYAFNSSFIFDKNNRISAGFLTKSDTANNNKSLLSFSGHLTPLSWAKTDFEVAVAPQSDQLTKAFSFAFYLNRSIFSANLNCIYADPEFSGYVKNTIRIFSGFSLSLKKLSFNLNYDINSSNFELDTIYSNAPFSKTLGVSSSYRINTNNSLTLGAYSIALKDRAPTPLFDYNKYNGRIALQSKIQKMSLGLQGEFGKIDNFLVIKEGELTNYYNGSMSLSYMFNQSISALGYLSYQGGQQYQVTGYDRFYYGGALLASTKDAFSVSLNYNSNYELKDYSFDRSLLSLQLSSKINARHLISLGANYNLVKNTLDKKEFGVQLRYTYTLNVPTSRNKEYGSLTGQIINHGVETVEGIILNLNGKMTITDKDGKFRFPVAKAGTFALITDESSFGINSIPEVRGPYLVTIVPGKVNHFELAFTKSARIVGKLVIQEDEKAGQKGYFPIKEALEKVIVEASNEVEVFRVMTDENGNFSFEDLRPGTWRVKVYSNGIPQGYQLITDLFNFTLSPGKNESVEVIIKKKIRQIKFQSKF